MDYLPTLMNFQDYLNKNFLKIKFEILKNRSLLFKQNNNFLKFFILKTWNIYLATFRPSKWPL